MSSQFNSRAMNKHMLKTQPALQRLFSWVLDVYRSSYTPDPNSLNYFTVARQRKALIAMLAFNVISIAFWHFFYSGVPTPYVLFALMVLVNIFVAINNLFRIFHNPSQLAFFMHAFWLNMPFQLFAIYFWVQYHGNSALAHLCVILVLYLNTSDWRGSLMGALSALPLAGIFFYFWTGAWPALPPLMDVLLLVLSMAGATAVAASGMVLDGRRQRYTDKVLRTTEEKLTPMLETQADLIGSYRFNVKNIMQAEPEYKAEALRIGEQLQALNEEMLLKVESMNILRPNMLRLSQMQHFSARTLLRQAVADLGVGHGYSLPQLQKAFELDDESDFRIEANPVELSVALASLLDVMLNSVLSASRPADAGPLSKPYIRIKTGALMTGGELRIETLYPCVVNVRPKHVLLPVFSEQTFPLYEVSWKIERVRADGAPDAIVLKFTRPSFFSSTTFSARMDLE